MYLKFSSIGSIVLSSLFLILLSSCGSLKDVVYFQNADSKYAFPKDLPKHEIRIFSNDNLFIMVSAKNQQAADEFNILKQEGTNNVSTLNWRGYLVDESGCINFPLIGKIRLSGLTKSEAITLLQNKISDYIIDPVVNIRFMNYKITVIGEVKNPGVFTIDDEKLTIIQALGLAGDLTIYGNRRKISINREVAGRTQFHRVDITSPEIFNSPVYYLQQNDVVYVEPNKAKAETSSYSQYYSLALSVTSFLFTLAVFFIKK